MYFKKSTTISDVRTTMHFLFFLVVTSDYFINIYLIITCFIKLNNCTYFLCNSHAEIFISHVQLTYFPQSFSNQYIEEIMYFFPGFIIYSILVFNLLYEIMIKFLTYSSSLNFIHVQIREEFPIHSLSFCLFF